MAKPKNPLKVRVTPGKAVNIKTKKQFDLFATIVKKATGDKMSDGEFKTKYGMWNKFKSQLCFYVDIFHDSGTPMFAYGGKDEFKKREIMSFDEFLKFQEITRKSLAA